ncbi:MAG: hypothetical protein WKI04_13135 [Ferruginibacter sp.]
MKNLSVLAFCVFSFSVAAQHKTKWEQLFNGKNLDGWMVKIRGYELNDNFGNTFRVENGVMKVSYTPTIPSATNLAIC